MNDAMLFDACFSLVTLNSSYSTQSSSQKSGDQSYSSSDDSQLNDLAIMSDTSDPSGQSDFQMDFNQDAFPDTTENMFPDTTSDQNDLFPGTNQELLFPDTTQQQDPFAPDTTQQQDPFAPDTAQQQDQFIPGEEDIIDTSAAGFDFGDSSRVTVDSTLAPDSLFWDSTARMEHFRYQRKDKPYTPLNIKKRSKFFAYPSSSMAVRNVQVDSSGKMVEITETIAGEQTKILLRVPLDEYIDLKMKSRNRELWEQLGYKYEAKADQNDLGTLITDFTNIDIPLPSAGFLSIFGPPNIKLSIGGAVDIHGAWRNETREGVTASFLGNTRNEPDFKQQVQINVNGTIGDKLSIRADWNTERTFEYENQLKLKYTGYEDEIVKNVEAGNVSLQTSPLVGGSEALFGVKADFQFGPLNLTTIASQKKGEVKEVAISGGSTSQEFSLHAYDYSKNHYFLDTIYASTNPELNLFERYYANPVPDIDPRYQVIDIEVWKTATGQRILGSERQVNAYIDLPVLAGNNYDALRADSSVESSTIGKVEIGRFIKLTEGQDYDLHRETGFITFRTQIQDNEALAIAYRREGPSPESNDDEIFGEFVNEDTTTTRKLILKLIKPKELQPKYEQAWKLQLKNIYPIGGRKVNEEGFVLDIFYALPGSEPANLLNGVPLLSAFGLDELSGGGTPGKDGSFDFILNRTIFTETGEIIFPVLEPFGRDFPQAIPGADTLKYQDVYDTTVTYARQNGAKDRFLLQGKYSASSTAVFNLGFVGVVENSVKVLLGGRELTANVDYVVDYNIGQVTIKNAAALVPGADLKITYEQNDIFQLASKTLLGARGLFNFSEKTQLGFSALNLNQQTLSDKVRIGEEPLNNSIYGVDFKTSVDLPFVTQGLNSVIPSKQMSSFSVGGEFAYINPDPNTKKSTVASDLSQSIAYIDDFEGAKRTIPIGISYTSWRDLSVPDRMPVIGDSSRVRQMNYKGKSYWFNVLPSDVEVTDIWPLKEAARGEDQITVLDFVFDPRRPGTYNRTPNLTANPELNWGGMMKILSQTATNLVEENIEFIEFWMKLDNNIISHQGNQFDSLYIDLGKISEDVIPNGQLDTEDDNENDLIDNGEDRGMDFLVDSEEPGYNAASNPDPNGDNYNFSLGQGNYQQINGTENNSASLDAGRFPDTEDLNRNLTLDQLNSYFRYAVPLDTVRTTNPYITGGGGNDNWYQIRIPLQDFKRRVGDPSFSIVEFIRVWINGVTDPIHLRIAEFNLVGSQWQKVVNPLRPQDSTLALSVVNIEDNPGYYTMPGGIQRERDRTNTERQILRNEQSLALIIKELNDNDQRQVVKYLRPMDLFNYKEMKLFVHGDSTISSIGDNSLAYYVDTSNYNSEVYFRFGSDTTNYYEYRLPLQGGWQELSIKFSELTTIKSLRSGTPTDSTGAIDSTRLRNGDKYPVSGAPGHYYRLRGNPALTRISFFMIGVENPKGKQEVPTPVSGQVWINELRVIGADDSKGWAYSTNARFNLGDLMTVNVNMSQTNPFFHKLSDRFGTRLDSKNWGFNVDFDILKLIPFNMPGSNLKINYARTEQSSNPLYVPGTDVKVDGAAQQLAGRVAQDSISRFVSATKTLNISDTWSLSGMKFKVPSKSWIWNYSINALTFSFNYNKTKGRNPQTATNSTWIWNANINYQANLSQNNFFYPADIPILGTILGLFKDYRNAKIYYTPQSFTWNLTATRNYSFNLQRIRTALPLIGRDFKTTRNAQVGWKLTEGGLLNLNMTYGFDFQSSLAHILTRDGINSRSESDIWNDIFTDAFFGRNYQFQQSFEIRTQPKLPSIWKLKDYFTLQLGYGSSYQWQNNFQQLELGRGAGFSNKINASITLKLKSLSAPLFREDKPDPRETRNNNLTGNQNAGNTRARREQNNDPQREVDSLSLAGRDSLNIARKDSLGMNADSLAESGPSRMQNLLLTMKSVVKTVFFDYETIQFNFSQDNTVSKSGIRSGGTGFVNFFTFSTNNEYGPSRSFMLGLSQNVGPRAINGNLSDNATQRNNLDFRTARPLWEGANIDLRWKIGWMNSKSATIVSDSLGEIRVTNINSTGSINRSFVSIPLGFLGGGLKKVDELYDPSKDNLNEAFNEGLEAFPILARIPILKEFAKYIPRPNWNINWDGLEKYSMFKSFTKRVSLQHAYQSDYAEGWKLDPDGNQVTQNQKISYGFAPLVGLNMTFASLWNGNFTGSIKYSTKTGYDLGASTKNITETSSRDIGISASYSKSGFELPLFGLSLKNDIEMTFSYTYSKNSVIIFNMTQFDEKGIPQDGTIRTTMEPRIKYVMSAKVTLSVFYRRSSVVPEGAARISPTTTNEAGLDVHIAIQ